MKQQQFKCRVCGKIFIDPTYIFESDKPIVQHACFDCAEKETQDWLDRMHENGSERAIE